MPASHNCSSVMSTIAVPAHAGSSPAFVSYSSKIPGKGVTAEELTLGPGSRAEAEGRELCVLQLSLFSDFAQGFQINLVPLETYRASGRLVIALLQGCTRVMSLQQKKKIEPIHPLITLMSRSFVRRSAGLSFPAIVFIIRLPDRCC